ncbi:CHAT domain-containing protein [Pleurocapsales cyanobacterium LEGE 06147]|nr:CHAT domain-containing protein [Pleurocapsales cyanobacterium LEGE 06147]
MRLRIKQGFVLLIVLGCIGLLSSLSISSLTKSKQIELLKGIVFWNHRAVAAQELPIDYVVSRQTDGAALEAKGKQFYALGEWTQAISFWERAIQAYALLNDSIAQARVLSNLALAYQQLGNWEHAEQAIQDSLKLLDERTSLARTKSDRDRVLAQALNNQGMLQLARGESEAALASWQIAAEVYEQIGEETGVIRSQINQVSAFKALGMYRRALKLLVQVNRSLEKQPDSISKAVALRSYGDMLRLVGELKEAQQVLEQSLATALELELPVDEVKTLLALGNLVKARGKNSKAFEFYHQGLTTCQSDRVCTATIIPLQINLARLSLLIETGQWHEADQIVPAIQSKLSNLAPSRTNIYQQINFVRLSLDLKSKLLAKPIKLQNVPSWDEIKEILTDATQKARLIGDLRAESHAIGLQGRVDELLQQWASAEKLTKQALVLAQTLNASEVTYLWQWQLGRIWQARGERQKAIAIYSDAVSILESLSQDLVAIDPDLQYSFRESVEPVYRELVSLLLQSESGEEVSQANLIRARDIIESLQIAELNNFFREACLNARQDSIDQIDRQAAVIYPIILRDRLEVILSLPQQPLRHYTVSLEQKKVERAIEQLRRTVVIRSRREFYTPAQQLYNWLIRPALTDLTSKDIKTIVFVLDGTLRNIPVAALHDGQHFLIEQYNVALTPGLQLLASRPLEQIKLKTLAAGVTLERPGFPALDYVNLELEEIQEQVASVVLVNKQFTREALEQQIQFSYFPIVHIATHGQFSSNIEETFLLAWDSRINLNQLDRILQTRIPTRERAIELLVLSACETASGDKWAGLGLAGIAVRAGTRSTVATLWSVNDKATAELMGQFYRELATKQITKAEAVRQAQLTLLKNPFYQHPFYWAPYVLIGNWL